MTKEEIKKDLAGIELGIEILKTELRERKWPEKFKISKSIKYLSRQRTVFQNKLK